MENRRQVNQQHKHKDKKRNEKAAKPNRARPQNRSESGSGDENSTTSNPIFSKRTVSSNWGRYDAEALHTEDNEQMNAADFTQLLDTPLSVGSHFVFSNERNWNPSSIDTTFGSQYFRFDLAVFEQQMSTIPFYERQAYDVGLFSEDELFEMNRQAKLAEMTFKQMSTQKQDINMKSSVRKLIHSVEIPLSPVDKGLEIHSVSNNSEEDELSVLLDLTLEPTNALPRTSTKKTIVKKPNSTNDIQQWLDDILDE